MPVTHARSDQRAEERPGVEERERGKEREREGGREREGERVEEREWKRESGREWKREREKDERGTRKRNRRERERSVESKQVPKCPPVPCAPIRGRAVGSAGSTRGVEVSLRGCGRFIAAEAESEGSLVALA